MTLATFLFLLVSGALIVGLPRRVAALPLFLAVAFTTRIPVVELGPANLTVLRVLVLCGFVRILLRGERLANGVNAVDRWLFVWALILVGMSVFHTSDAWTYRIGMVLSEVGVYLLCRIFIQDTDDLRATFATICVSLLPLAVLLLLEKAAARNFFEVMGAAGEANIREGHVRATGPFAHAILAGTVGAMCVPMSLCIWRTHLKSALVGLVAGAGIVFASTSSGPIMMLLYVFLALAMWKLRHWLRLIRWGALTAVLVLQAVMHDPVYFLMARIDITGGSTGYYRAQLIRSSLEHVNEWWQTGTDYTRHWMASGIHANEIHTDVVNHFLAMGVLGGVPLLLVFILLLRAAFRQVGLALDGGDDQTPARPFLVWTLGAMLFGQVMSFWAISPYDQSVSFLYLILAALGAIQTPLTVAARQRVALAFRPIRPHPAVVRMPTPFRGGRNVPSRGGVGTRSSWASARAAARLTER